VLTKTPTAVIKTYDHQKYAIKELRRFNWRGVPHRGEGCRPKLNHRTRLRRAIPCRLQTQTWEENRGNAPRVSMCLVWINHTLYPKINVYFFI
jgi:hypothetical protein